MQEIFQSIKQSKKYKHLSDEVIEEKINEYKKKNPRWEEHKEKFVIKEIKALLHKAYGSFQEKNINKRPKYLEELKQDPKDLDKIDTILSTNSSTKERLEIYDSIYKDIFKLTGIPGSILDLGCGLNPFSIGYMNLKPSELSKLKYFCCDISKADINLLTDFFNISHINGEAQTLNLTRIENIQSLPNADVCFMFKLIDVLEREKKGHKYAEEIIQILKDKCKFIVASFATRTITNQPMNFPQRGWIERMLTRINLKYKVLEFDNEIFYVINKK